MNLILAVFGLSETGQIWGFRVFPGDRWRRNFACIYNRLQNISIHTHNVWHAAQYCWQVCGLWEVKFVEHLPVRLSFSNIDLEDILCRKSCTFIFHFICAQLLGQDPYCFEGWLTLTFKFKSIWKFQISLCLDLYTKYATIRSLHSPIVSRSLSSAHSCLPRLLHSSYCSMVSKPLHVLC